MHSGEQADAGRVIASIFARHAVVDLTLPLAETLPNTWPGHMPFRATVWSWLTERGGDPQPVHPQTGGSYQARWLVMDEHTGTHLDAPRHFVPPPSSGLPHAGPGGDVGVDGLPLLAAAGPADVIDVTGLTREAAGGESALISADYLSAWAELHGPPQAGDVVLLRSDWDERYVPGPDGSRYGADALVSKTGPAWPAPTPTWPASPTE